MAGSEIPESEVPDDVRKDPEAAKRAAEHLRLRAEVERIKLDQEREKVARDRANRWLELGRVVLLVAPIVAAIIAGWSALKAQREQAQTLAQQQAVQARSALRLKIAETVITSESPYRMAQALNSLLAVMPALGNDLDLRSMNPRDFENQEGNKMWLLQRILEKPSNKEMLIDYYGRLYPDDKWIYELRKDDAKGSAGSGR